MSTRFVLSLPSIEKFLLCWSRRFPTRKIQRHLFHLEQQRLPAPGNLIEAAWMVHRSIAAGRAAQFWRSHMSKSVSHDEVAVRELRADEVEAVTGAILGGCIRLPTISANLPQEPAPFVDQFAKRLPSWVRPL